jgi:AGZA family xanthine/uracil permease-like MFS transporter
MILRVRGAFMIGIVVSTLLAIFTRAPVFQGQPFAGFDHGLVQAPIWPKDLLMAFDLKGALSLSLVTTIFSMFFVEFFDSAGTLVSLAAKAGFTDATGNIEKGSKAFIADGIATTFGAVAGTSSTTTYIEAMAGIEDGGRTGLTALTVAVLFLLSMCFWPLAAGVPSVATAPAMILVGALMMTAAVGIPWDDMRQAIPAFLTMIAMPLTYSIANGISLGIIAYTSLHVFTGRARQVHWLMYALSAVLLVKQAYFGTH